MNARRVTWRIVAAVLAAAASLTLTPTTTAQTLSGNAIASALQKGGYFIVMRHASSPSQAPGVADGESLIFRPDGTGGAALVGRIKIEEWPSLR